MKTKILTTCFCLFLAGKASAQWTVIDPSNIAQSIVNTSKNVAHTSTTATHMAKNFQETVKIYEQGKKYYDALKSVNNLVKDARKVQQTILMVGDIDGHLHEQLPEDDARREFHGGGTVSHRLRLHQTAGGE